MSEKKKPFDRLRSYFYDTTVDYQDKAFVLFSMTVLIALFVAIPCGLIMREPLIATVSTAIGTLFFSVYVIFTIKKNRIKRAKIVISIILVFFFLPGMFFTNGGVEGGAPIWLLLGTIYITMILEGRFKAVMLGLNAIVTVLTWIVGYRYPELVTTYSRGGNYFDTIAALLIVSFIVYALLGLNKIMERSHEKEILSMQGEQMRMKRLFDQTATAFVSAVEKKDDFTKGNAVRTANYARRIATLAGKNEEECEKAYYTALLHDVGLIGIPDKVIKNDTDPNKRDYEAMREKPLIGAEILSSITEYPYLRQGALYSHERYNGKGYPEGLKGEEIPEIARIVGVADSYVTMTTRKRYRDAWPDFMAREAFIKGAGEEYDPAFAGIMVKIMDSETNEKAADNKSELEEEIACKAYREQVSRGIPVEGNMRKISFECELEEEPENGFSAPSIILFDSYDGRFHFTAKEIDRYAYLEYGEIWFDKYSVTTAARNIEEKEIDDKGTGKSPEGNLRYEIIAGRYEDHLKLIMRADDYAKEVIVALPSGSKASYIGLTGENCRLLNIQSETTGETVQSEDIPRIAKPVSYIEHFEADIKNIQIDQTRSATTEGVELKNRLIFRFHTMSLPVSSLVWHCPYILLYGSDDGKVGGPGYREYDLIKLDGEDQGDGEYARNRFVVKKTDAFPGWPAWQEANKEGLNCEVFFERKGGQIVMKTETLGISLENTTTLNDEHDRVYVAITGDQVALTDIRIE